MGFSGTHTFVPTVPGDKKSPKIPESTRWDLVANSWHIPCLRFWAICILFSTGVQPSTAEVRGCPVILALGWLYGGPT